MFGWGKKDKATRKLETPAQLQQGDYIELSDSLKLPTELQNSQLEVLKVTTTQYSANEQETSFILKDGANRKYSLSIDDNDGDPILCFGLEISESLVKRLFGGDEFAQLWEPEQAELEVKEQIIELEGWVGSGYSQSNLEEGIAFFYDKDSRGSKLSQYEEDDDGEEYHYFECEGHDDRYGLSVEFWEDGTTEVYLECYCPFEVVSQMWPKS